MEKMKEYLKKVMADGDGTPSAMRWMSVVALFAGIVIAFVGLLKGKDLSTLAVLCGVFVGSAFGGKVAQSSIENRN